MPVETCRWLGAYLTNGRRLVQVIAVGAKELMCEDVRAPLDAPMHVWVPYATIVRSYGGWRVVREGPAA